MLVLNKKHRKKKEKSIKNLRVKKDQIKMSHKCSARRSNNMKCKNSVPSEGDYCRYHISMKPEVIKCKCVLTNGSPCPYIAIPKYNGFCEYHVESSQCDGTLLLGSKCLKYIPYGRFCDRCKHQEGVLDATIVEKSNNMRSLLSKDEPIISQGKPVVIHYNPAVIKVQPHVVVPPVLKKINLGEKPSNCPICFDELGEKVNDHRMLKCGHWFHVECLSKTDKLTCPMCRSGIDAGSIPKWATLRIKETIKSNKIEQEQQNNLATAIYIAGLMNVEGSTDHSSSIDEDSHSDENEDLIQGFRGINLESVFGTSAN